MKTNRGYIDIDFGAIAVAFLFVGAIAGICLWTLADWLWPIVKAWIHAVTAG